MAKTINTTETPNNEAIKAMLKDAGLPLWKLAQTLCVHESTVIRNLREPLKGDKYNLYLEATKKTIEKAKATA